MNGISLRILKQVQKNAEVTLAEAIQLAKARRGNHLDQYPLAMLLEGGYLGVTINDSPPSGQEKMREFALARSLHILSLPKREDGDVHYLGIVSTGTLDPSKERVFLKAKGALYLDEHRQKRSDRIWSFVLGLLAGVLTTLASSWVRGHLKLP